MLTLIAFGRRCKQDKLVVKLAERKRFVTITNVTTGSGATVSVFAVLSSLAPALRSAASLRVPAAEHGMRPSPAPKPHSPTYPP